MVAVDKGHASEWTRKTLNHIEIFIYQIEQQNEVFISLYVHKYT